MRKGLQPSVGSIQKPQSSNNKNGVRNVQVAKRATATTLRTTGAGMQVAGKGMKHAGKASVKAGTRLTATGIGAIVGVPLIAIGGAATGAGFGMNAAGKQMSRSGRKMQRSLKKKSISLSNPLKSVHIKVLMVGCALSLPISFLTLFEMAFLLAAGAIQAVGTVVEEVLNDENVLSQVTKFVVDGVSYAVGSASDALKEATGGALDIGGLIGAVDPANYFVVFWVLAMSWGYITLLIVWAIYFFSGSKPLSEPGAGDKKMAFLAALIMYSLPLAHIFPWFLLCIHAVRKNSN